MPRRAEQGIHHQADGRSKQTRLGGNPGNAGVCHAFGDEQRRERDPRNDIRTKSVAGIAG